MQWQVAQSVQGKHIPPQVMQHKGGLYSLHCTRVTVQAGIHHTTDLSKLLKVFSSQQFVDVRHALVVVSAVFLVRRVKTDYKLCTQATTMHKTQCEDNQAKS